jgi:hypothetical protein
VLLSRFEPGCGGSLVRADAVHELAEIRHGQRADLRRRDRAQVGEVEQVTGPGGRQVGAEDGC